VCRNLAIDLFSFAYHLQAEIKKAYNLALSAERKKPRPLKSPLEASNTYNHV